MTADELLLLRRKAKITQGQLAERIGYSRQAVVKWERGIHDIPGKVLNAIMDACTTPAPTVEKFTARDRDTVERYTMMRGEPTPMSHARILEFWRDNDFTPSPAAQAAILAAFPDILNNAELEQIIKS